MWAMSPTRSGHSMRSTTTILSGCSRFIKFTSLIFHYFPSQAGLINLENDHEKFELEQPLEALKLDQFILPFVILASGCWIALVIFLTEVIRLKLFDKCGHGEGDIQHSISPPLRKHALEYKSSILLRPRAKLRMSSNF